MNILYVYFTFPSLRVTEQKEIQKVKTKHQLYPPPLI